MLESVLATRHSQTGQAILELDGTKIWGRLTFQSIRVLQQRFVLVLIENLTPEIHQLQRNEELRRELETKVRQLEKADKELRASVDEKELLLREIHHRVKNNLTIVSTMLGLQAMYATDIFHRRMFEDSQSRLHSLAVAHEKLYQTKSLAEVKAPEYFMSLLDHLVGSAQSGGGRISSTLEIEDVILGSDTAMRLGFVFTELVSNCLKHAFPGESAGAIQVILRSIGEGEFELLVSDNGVGMPAEIDLEHPESFGLQVVNIFVRTLNGCMEVKRTDGTEFSIRFRETE
jgi:two-component sensor histidine kinase